MRNCPSKSTDKMARSSLLAAVGAGLLASVCCLGPLGAAVIGAGGAWAGQLSALEPYRPFFIVLALGALGGAWYREARRLRGLDCGCEMLLRPKARQLLLGLVTVLVLGLLAAPSFVRRAPAVAMTQPVSNEPIRRVTLQVQGLTCAACSQAVVYALQRVEGVQAVEVTLEPPEARVRFDAEKVLVTQLIEAVRNAGFEATLKEQS